MSLSAKKQKQNTVIWRGKKGEIIEWKTTPHHKNQPKRVVTLDLAFFLFFSS